MEMSAWEQNWDRTGHELTGSPLAFRGCFGLGFFSCRYPGSVRTIMPCEQIQLKSSVEAR